MDSQVISTLNALSEKFGIAIDWTSKNVMPYLQTIMNKYILSETIKTAITVIICLSVVIFCIYSIKNTFKGNWFGGDAEMCGCIICMALVMILICGVIGLINIYDLVDYLTIPELKFLEYLKCLAQTY